jgi:hypothetical protein
VYMVGAAGSLFELGLMLLFADELETNYPWCRKLLVPALSLEEVEYPHKATRFRTLRNVNQPHRSIVFYEMQTIVWMIDSMATGWSVDRIVSSRV